MNTGEDHALTSLKLTFKYRQMTQCSLNVQINTNTYILERGQTLKPPETG